MKPTLDIARISSCLDNPARAGIIRALMSGQAFTMNELAIETQIPALSVKEHLEQLMDMRLVCPEDQGRHQYFKLAGDDVATALHGMPSLLGETGPKRVRFGPKEPELRKARVCYNHIAGELGVRLYKSMAAQGFFDFANDEISLTPTGQRFANTIGIEIVDQSNRKKPVCRSCLDWSERRYHLAGAFGIALLDSFLEKDWVNREGKSRVLTLTRGGEEAVEKYFPA